MIRSKKTAMPCVDASLRVTNFQEVATGYGWKEALEESQRCLQCKTKPCVKSCPVAVDIPAFIEAILQKDVNQAAQIIYQTNCFPSICGRVCPQEVQCEMTCVVGIKNEPVAIGRLERFVGDYAQINLPTFPQNSKKIAVVGSGPAGLSCAYDCALAGYQVTVFEAWHDVGGVLRYGIPEFRLPKYVVDREIQVLRSMGVQFEVNVVVGKTVSCEDLFDMNYDAIFLGTGAGLPHFLNIEGEGLVGVYSANEFLTRVNFMKANQRGYDTPLLSGKKAIIIGGGNVAMDAARCARRLGYDTTIVYRRSMVELPARQEEIHHAIEEGIQFRILSSPVRFIGNAKGRVTHVECQPMRLSEVDDSGRRRVEVDDQPPFILEADTMIIAVGTSPNPIISRCTPQLTIHPNQTIIVDSNQQTSIDGIYAGGDAVTGAATVIEALGAGKKAAQAIIDRLSKSENAKEI